MNHLKSFLCWWIDHDWLNTKWDRWHLPIEQQCKRCKGYQHIKTGSQIIGGFEWISGPQMN